MKKYGEEFVTSGYEGYLVSRSGKIYSMRTNALIGGQVDDQGYILMCLMVDGKRHFVRLHTIVANAFLKKPKGANKVTHINGNKEDNRASNLKWIN